MKKILIIILFISLTFSFNLLAETFLFGHENLTLGMDKDRVLRLVDVKKTEPGGFPHGEYLYDNKIYLIGGFEFNREILLTYNKIHYITLTSMKEYDDIATLGKDIDILISLFDEKGISLSSESLSKKPKIIEGKKKTYPQKTIFKDELGIEYSSSEKCITNNENSDTIRKYEFENSNLSLSISFGYCYNRDDLYYSEITIYYLIDAMGIYMKEYLKDNPPKKIIKKSNF